MATVVVRSGNSGFRARKSGKKCRGITATIHKTTYAGISKAARARGIRGGSRLDAEITQLAKTKTVPPEGLSSRARSIISALHANRLRMVDAQVPVANVTQRRATAIDLLLEDIDTREPVVAEVKYTGSTAARYRQLSTVVRKATPAYTTAVSGQVVANTTHAHYMDQLLSGASLYATTHRMRAESTVRVLLIVAASDTTLVFPETYHHKTLQQLSGVPPRARKSVPSVTTLAARLRAKASRRRPTTKDARRGGDRGG